MTRGNHGAAPSPRPQERASDGLAPTTVRAHDPATAPRDAPHMADSAVRLRPTLPPVTRLSRRVVWALAGSAALLVAMAFGYALQVSRQSAETEQPPADAARPAEQITRAPRDYSEVPRLVPLQPHDAGAAVPPAGQEAQPAGDRAAPAATPAATPSASSPGSATEARQHRLAESAAARESRLFAGVQREPLALLSDSMTTAGGAVGPPPPPTAPPQSRLTAATAANEAFLARPGDAATVSNARLVPPAGQAVLQAGSIIPAALITGLRSDLPGQVTAQVTQNVYDSLTGRILLIAQGARLIGAYDAAIAAGQRRALLVWTRLLLPDGRSLVLDRLPGADATGQAGLEDRTDFHWGGVIRAAAVSTLLAVGAGAGSDKDDALVRALRQGSQDSISRTGSQVVARALDVPPTLTIRPGYPVRVILTRDIVFDAGDERH